MASSHMYLTSIGLQGLILAALLSALSYCIYSYFFSPLAGIPGPLSARLGLPGWYFLRALRRDFGWQLRNQHNKHGHFVRIAPNVVSISDPAAITRLYETKDSGWTKSEFYHGFAVSPDGKPNLFTTLDPRAHSLKRRPLSRAYSMQTITQLEQFVDPVTTRLVEILGKTATRQESIEMGHVLQYYAMDTIGELAFGKDFDMLQSDADALNIMPALETANIDAGIVGSFPAIRKVWNWFRAAQVALGVHSAGNTHLLDVTVRRVKDRQERLASGEEGRPDMLTTILNAKHVDGTPYGFNDVAEGVGAAVAAGSDTTAIALRAFLYYMVKNPEVCQKLVEELDKAVEAGELTFPVSYAQGTHLPYLQACIKETLRLHPSVFWILPRFVPAGGAVLAGRFFPAGVEVGMSPFVSQRTKEAYGPDTAVFRPERWLEASEDELKILNRNLITFGTGTRVCLGRSISLMEMTKVLPHLLRHFDFQFTARKADGPHKLPGRGYAGLIDDTEPWHMDYAWFSVQHDYWLDVRKREGMW